MSAYMFIFKRDKKDGFYQNDRKCKEIGALEGWKAFDYGNSVLTFTFEPEGTAVLSSCEDSGVILKNMLEYDLYFMENLSSKLGNFFAPDKYDFMYRVAEPFFNELLDKKTFKEWAEDEESKEDKKWVREQLSAIRKSFKTFDFEKYYYYVGLSY